MRGGDHVWLEGLRNLDPEKSRHAPHLAARITQSIILARRPFGEIGGWVLGDVRKAVAEFGIVPAYIVEILQSGRREITQVVVLRQRCGAAVVCDMDKFEALVNRQPIERQMRL